MANVPDGDTETLRLPTALEETLRPREKHGSPQHLYKTYVEADMSSEVYNRS